MAPREQVSSKPQLLRSGTGFDGIVALGLVPLAAKTRPQPVRLDARSGTNGLLFLSTPWTPVVAGSLVARGIASTRLARNLHRNRSSNRTALPLLPMVSAIQDYPPERMGSICLEGKARRPRQVNRGEEQSKGNYLREKLTSIFKATSTATPFFIPGRNFHCFSAWMAFSSNPSPRPRTTFKISIVPSLRTIADRTTTP